MLKKEYLTPEVEEVNLNLEGCLMNGSAKGFTDEPGFDNSGWTLD